MFLERLSIFVDHKTINGIKINFQNQEGNIDI